MGYYINKINGELLGAPYEEKCEGLLKNGAIEVSDEKFQENLVCVVNNGLFSAAGYAFSEKEFDYMRIHDGRPRKWFIVSNADILSGYNVKK